MYNFILEQKLAAFIAALLLALCACAIAGGRLTLWWRGILYSYMPSLAAAFYATAFFADAAPFAGDLAAGLLFEFTVLVLFYRQFRLLRRDLETVSRQSVTKALGRTMVVQVICAVPLIAAGGFGIFSDESRIGYLYTGSLPKYFTYASFLATTAQVALLAALVSTSGRLGSRGWSVILLNFAISVTSGSKGAVFLWLASIASLIDYRRARIPAYKLFGALAIGIGAFLVSSLAVAQFFDLDFDVFLDVAFSRFFLNNDARALAFDLRNWHSASYSMFSESFRSLGNLLGIPPRNDPLGVQLYGEAFAIENGNGANASFMALGTYYFPAGYAFIPAVLGIIGILGVAQLAGMTSSLLHRPVQRVIVRSIWLVCLALYTQDFLAFQVLLPLAILTILIFRFRNFAVHGTSTKLPQGSA